VPCSCIQFYRLVKGKTVGQVQRYDTFNCQMSCNTCGRAWKISVRIIMIESSILRVLFPDVSWPLISELQWICVIFPFEICSSIIFTYMYMSQIRYRHARRDRLLIRRKFLLFLILWFFSVLSSGFITDALGYQMLLKENGTVLNVKIKWNSRDEEEDISEQHTWRLSG